MLDPVSPDHMLVETSEEALVEQAQAGDEGAFATLYDLYFPRVYRYVLARLGNAADAEDVTAEVFEKMIGAISRFEWRDDGSFAAWLLRIAHNQVVSHHRRTDTRPKTMPLSDHLPLGGPEPEEIVQRKLALEEMRLAMDQLPDAQRQVLLLRFAAGLSISETAKVLGKQENNVKVLQHKGIARLQQILLAVGDPKLRARSADRRGLGRRLVQPAATEARKRPAFSDE